MCDVIIIIMNAFVLCYGFSQAFLFNPSLLNLRIQLRWTYTVCFMNQNVDPLSWWDSSVWRPIRAAMCVGLINKEQLTGSKWCAETDGDRKRRRRERWQMFQRPIWRPKRSTGVPPIQVMGHCQSLRQRHGCCLLRHSLNCYRWPFRSLAVGRSQSTNSTSFSSPWKGKIENIEKNQNNNRWK